MGVDDQAHMQGEGVQSNPPPPPRWLLPHQLMVINVCLIALVVGQICIFALLIVHVEGVIC